MTSDELAEIEARANAATPGPWECEVRHGAPSIKGGPVHNFARGAGRHQILSVVGQDWMRADEPTCNAKFAAHARTDIPALVAAVRERDAAKHEAMRCQDDNERLRISLSVAVGLLSEIQNWRHVRGTTMELPVQKFLAEMRAGLVPDQRDLRKALRRGEP